MPSKEKLLEEAYKSLVEIDEKKVFNVIDEWQDREYETKELLEIFAEAFTEISRTESMLRIAGFTVIDTGKEQYASEIIDAAVDNAADILQSPP